MPWGRLDDQANDNPKLLALSDAAWRMWGCGLIYCQNKLTDGFIPAPIIATFGVRARNLVKVVGELLAVLVPGKGPLWHEEPGGYRVHDYLDWNDSRESVLKKREGIKNRQARFRQSQQPEQRNGVNNALCNALQTALPLLGVTRDVTRNARGTYKLRTSYQYHGSTVPEQKLTKEYSAENAGAPPVTCETSENKPSLWTVSLAIAHRVIEDFPNQSEAWSHELKARMLNQGIDANDQGPKGNKPKFFARVLDACLEQRKFRKGDGGVNAWRYRHQARQAAKRRRRVG